MTAIQFIAVGWTLTFMIPFIIWNCILIYCLEDESPGFAFMATLIFFALIQFCSDFSFFQWINLNTGTIIKWGLAYIVIGVGYGVLKYIMYLTDKKRSWDRVFGQFVHNNKLPVKTTINEVPEELKYKCFKYMKKELGYTALPDLSTSTKHIVFWMSYWPWSAFWTILNNPLKWIFQYFSDKLSRLFRRLHARLIGTRIDKMNEWEKADRDGNN